MTNKRHKRFRSFLCLVIALFVTTASSCSKTLAEYDGNKITKQTLTDFLDLLFPQSKDRILRDIKMQKRIVRQMAAIDILSSSNRAKDVEKQDNFRQEWRFIRYQVLSSRYRPYLREQFRDFDHIEAAHVRHILFRPKVRKDQPKDFGYALEKATRIYRRLQSGEDFAELARKFSEHPSGKDGGDIGFIPRIGSMDDNFTRAAFSLKVGSYSKPVKTRYGYHIIECVGKVTIRPANIDKFISAEKDRKRFIRSYVSGRERQYISDLKQKADIWMDTDRFLTAADEDTAVRTDKITYTRGQIVHILRKYYLRRTASELKKKEDLRDIDRDRLNAGLQRFYEFLLLGTDAEKNGFSGRSDIKKILYYTRQKFLSEYMLRQDFDRKIRITDDELREEYKKLTQPGKTAKGLRITPERIRRRSFMRMRDRLRRNIERRRKMSAKRKFIDRALKSGHFRIYDENFTALK